MKKVMLGILTVTLFSLTNIQQSQAQAASDLNIQIARFGTQVIQGDIRGEAALAELHNFENTISSSGLNAEESDMLWVGISKIYNVINYAGNSVGAEALQKAFEGKALEQYSISEATQG